MELNFNGINIPANMRGRFFFDKDTGPHFSGPMVVDNKVYIVKLWQNVSQEGRSYLRAIIEEPLEPL